MYIYKIYFQFFFGQLRFLVTEIKLDKYRVISNFYTKIAFKQYFLRISWTDFQSDRRSGQGLWFFYVSNLIRFCFFTRVPKTNLTGVNYPAHYAEGETIRKVFLIWSRELVDNGENKKRQKVLLRKICCNKSFFFLNSFGCVSLEKSVDEFPPTFRFRIHS